MGEANHEVVAQNVAIILARTGDEFRLISDKEYEAERLKDGNFTQSEMPKLKNIRGYLVSAEMASKFCMGWERALKQGEEEEDQ